MKLKSLLLVLCGLTYYLCNATYKIIEPIDDSKAIIHINEQFIYRKTNNNNYTYLQINDRVSRNSKQSSVIYYDSTQLPDEIVKCVDYAISIWETVLQNNNNIYLNISYSNLNMK